MKALSRYISLISVTGLLTGGTLVAQTAASGGTSGGGPSGMNDPTRSGLSPTPPRNSASSEVSGGVTSAEARTNDSSGVRPRNDSGSASSPARTSNNGYDTSSSTAAGTSRSTNVSATEAAFSSATDPLSSSMQTGEYSSRAQLANDIEQRLDSQKTFRKTLKDEGKRLQGQAKADFKAAYDELDAHEKELKRSLRETRNASPEKWEMIRSELASHYQAYMTALSRVQAQAGTGVSFPSTSSSNNNDATRTPDRSTTGSRANDPSPAPATSP